MCYSVVRAYKYEEQEVTNKVRNGLGKESIPLSRGENQDAGLRLPGVVTRICISLKPIDVSQMAKIHYYVAMLIGGLTG